MLIDNMPSKTSLRLLVALDQCPEMSLADLARAVRVPLTTAQSGVQSLERAGVIAKSPAPRRPSYRIDSEAPCVDALLQIARTVKDSLDIGLRANPSVGLAIRDEQGAVVVVREVSDPKDRLSLERLVEVTTPVRIIMESANLDRDEWTALRTRALVAQVITGSVDRYLWDRNAHSDFDAALPLGTVNPSLRPASARALRRLAKRYDLVRLSIHGSAVRDDFRPDSDVDVLVDLAPGASMSLMMMEQIREDLEALFGRRIDISLRGSLPPDFLERAEREEVTIYGHPGPHNS